MNWSKVAINCKRLLCWLGLHDWKETDLVEISNYRCIYKTVCQRPGCSETGLTSYGHL